MLELPQGTRQRCGQHLSGSGRGGARGGREGGAVGGGGGRVRPVPTGLLSWALAGPSPGLVPPLKLVHLGWGGAVKGNLSVRCNTVSAGS